MQNPPSQSFNASKAESSPIGAGPSGGHGLAGSGLLFLREEEFRIAQDKLFFALRDLNAAADAMLQELGFGRAHHRALHWIGRLPDLKVGELLMILGITKQSLARVLGPLVEQGYVAQNKGKVDRRQRLLSLTEPGVALERKLFECQRERLAAAYRDAGGPAVEGFRRVLRGMTTEQGRKWLDAIETARTQKGSRIAT
jgi:DNA-binding MarR family transcriptional regulator